jgi:hypothetical protein
LVEQPAGAQDADLVGDSLHVGQDVAGEDDGAPAAQAGDKGEHLGPPSWVQRGGGLVQDQQPGIAGQGAGQPEPLGHAPGEPADTLADPLIQAGGAQRREHGRAVRPGGEGPGQVDDFECGQPAIEFGDVGAHRHLAPRHGHLDGAAVGVAHAGDDGQQRGLPRAVGTSQPVHAARGDAQVDVEQAGAAVVAGQAGRRHGRDVTAARRRARQLSRRGAARSRGRRARRGRGHCGPSEDEIGDSPDRGAEQHDDQRPHRLGQVADRRRADQVNQAVDNQPGDQRQQRCEREQDLPRSHVDIQDVDVQAGSRHGEAGHHHTSEY